MAYITDSNKIVGWMNDKELMYLYVAARSAKSIVEVGSWKGRSAHALASGCRGTVYCVDHFRGSPNELQTAHREAADTDISEIFQENMKDFKNVEVMKMRSNRAAEQFEDNSIDMIFIDGTHTKPAVLTDLRSWYPKLRKGGLMTGHDAQYEEVREALNEFGKAWERIDGIETIWRLICDRC